MADCGPIAGNRIVIGDSQLGDPAVPRPVYELAGTKGAIGSRSMSMKID